jgi:hypothetical protein
MSKAQELLIRFRRITMFDYQMNHTTDRPQSALEIALQARIREREMALLAGEYKNAVARHAAHKTPTFLQVLFASLFLG